MDSLYFDISEYVRRPDLPLPIAVANTILRWHIWAMNPVRERLGIAITVSLKSGYRPLEHELEQGRDGTSTHCFAPTERDPDGLGAADYTCRKELLAELGGLMRALTGYTRICFYPNHLFFHGDYSHPELGRRVFIDKGDGWTQCFPSRWINEIEGVAGT